MSVISCLSAVVRHQSLFMIAATRDRQTLERAMSESGVKPRGELRSVGRTRSGQEKFQLTLAPATPHKFVRLSTSGRKMRNVSCAHGYECLAEHLFELDPDASIQSSAARRKGINKVTKGNLDWARQDIKSMNIGSQMIPLEYSKACNCESDLPAADYRAMLKETASDFSTPIRKAMGFVLRSEEAEKLR